MSFDLVHLHAASPSLPCLVPMVDGEPPPGVDGASDLGALDAAPSGLEAPSGALGAQSAGSVAMAASQ